METLQNKAKNLTPPLPPLPPQSPPPLNIKNILLKENYISQTDLQNAEKNINGTNTSLTDYLISKGIITKQLLSQAIAEAYRVPYADLQVHKPTKDQVLKINEDLARQYHVVLFREDNNTISVASDNPTSLNLQLELKRIFPGKTIVFNYAPEDDILELFIHYRSSLQTRFGSIIASQKKVAPEIISEIMQDAVINRASDIHFEPQDKTTLVRFRIDGVLHEAARIPREYYENILNRIKVLAHLRIDEHFATQDGAIRFVHDDTTVDVRVSIAPTLDGEKTVMRLLGEYVRSFTLYDLGLSKRHEEILRHESKKPFGMILVAGPTGSGKTTTLYALLKTLNIPNVNITTIEDPVEYKILGVNQIQVNKEANITFASGLRSIVRQDPDIILVGEIRDAETAEISVNAALTGQLLFSSFHANDAATAIPRLLEMGVEPFLLASTLELVIAQRLVRRLCVSCRLSSSLSTNELTRLYPAIGKYLSKKSTITLYKAKGCVSCENTGYKGRIAVFEFIQISKEMEELILSHPTAQEVWNLASKQGTVQLFEDGMEKVRNGITTIEELMRIAAPAK